MAVTHAPMPTPQAPIASDFNGRSTAAEVIRGHDLRDKTVVVTGGSAGIGLETTRVLASAGARVIVPPEIWRRHGRPSARSPPSSRWS